MLNFKEFLLEASSQSLRDPKGKLFELLVARHLHPGGYFPNIFRTNNKTPREVHDELKSKVSPEDYNAINHGAKKTASHVIKTLHSSKQSGVEPERISKDSSVSWTSNPNDYQKLMDKHSTTDKSTKSNADIVLTHAPKDGPVSHHAISLKYSSRIPTESGPGLARLEQHMGVNNKPLQKVSDKSLENIHRIMGEPNRIKAKETFKALHPSDSTYIRTREESLKGLTDIARTYHSGISKQDHNKLKRIVSNLSGVGSPHTYPHYRVRYNPDRDTVKMTNPVKTHKNIMENVKEIIPSLSGTSVHFHGITHDDNKIHLGTLNFKRKDSPLSNIQGSYKLGNIYH